MILGTAYVIIGTITKGLVKGLELAFKAVTGAMSGIAKAVTLSMQGVNKIIQRTLDLAKKAFLAFTAVVSASIWRAAAFETQMASVSTMLSEKTMPMIRRFSDGIDELSKAFGESTKTLSKGLYDILSASIAPAKALEVLAVSAQAAIAGMTSTEIAADAITTILNSYGMAAEKAAEVSDKLFATVKRGKITFGELASGIGMAASTAAIAGLSLEELLAVIATMTRAGLNASMSMTSVVGILKTFLAPSEGAAEAAKEFGMELSTNTLKSLGLLGVIKKLATAEDMLLAKIVPNIRGFRGMAAAIGDLAGFTYDVNFITKEFANQSSEAYSKMASTTIFKLKKFKETADWVFRTFGEPLLPAINKILEWTTELLKKLGDFIQGNQKQIKEWTKSLVWAAKDFATDLAAVVKNDIMPVFKEWFNVFQENPTAALKIIIDKMKEALIAFKDWFVGPFWGTIKTDILPIVIDIGKSIGIAIATAMKEKLLPIMKDVGEYIFEGAKTGAGKTWKAFKETRQKKSADIMGLEYGSGPWLKRMTDIYGENDKPREQHLETYKKWMNKDTSGYDYGVGLDKEILDELRNIRDEVTRNNTRELVN